MAGGGAAGLELEAFNPSLGSPGSGGAVVSTGSIAYVGSLAHQGDDNSVSRLTRNVLRRFLDPTPFATP